MRGLTGGAGGRAHRGARHRRGLFWELAGDGQGELRRPGAVSCRPSRTQRWEHRPARPAQWGHNALHPAPPSSALPHAPPHGPPPLTFSLSWPCPSGTSPASSTASTQAARHPISGASGGCGDPRTAARSGSGSPTSARTRPGAGEIAAGPRGRAKLRRGGGAGGRVVNRMCALGRALRSRRGSEVFRVFFFLPFILIYCVLVYWEVLVFVFLFLSFIFSCWGGGGAGDSWQCHLYLAAVCGPQAAI